MLDSKHGEGPSRTNTVARLAGEELPIGEPLPWRVVDQDGSVLLRAGTILCRESQRNFLLSHSALCTHGLEFEGLSSEQQVALKAFVFDKQDAISYWAAHAA
jgi:hypothetical protein